MNPRVCIITVCNPDYVPIGDITLPALQRYAQKHGYGVELGPYHTNPRQLLSYGDRGKYTLFEKFYNDYDIIMFLDIDAIVMNSDIKVEDVLGERNFLWTYGVDGPCSGFWIARTEPIVHLTLAYVANLAPIAGNVRTREDLGPPHKIVLEMEPRGQSDQEVMRSIMNMPPFDRVLGAENCVSLKEAGHCFDFRAIGWPEHFDYMGNYESGDWLLTFPGVPFDRRLQLLQAASEKAT